MFWTIKYRHLGKCHSYLIRASSATAARLWFRQQLAADIISVQQLHIKR